MGQVELSPSVLLACAAIAALSVAFASRFNVSPNSYGLIDPLVSTPVAWCIVSWRPALERPSEPSKSCNVL
jgi:hypothetical protein